MEKRRSRFGLLAAQSIVCAVLVAAVLLLRFVGGDLFEQLRQMFHTVIQEDVIGTALLERWQEIEIV